jgi:HopJ type III effector protein
MSHQDLLTQIKSKPDTVEFTDVITTIESNYHYTPTRFSNGATLINDVGSNEGSCKIFAFANINKLSKEQTLACFGSYYREDVLQHPENNDHGNIRSFISSGWEGIRFDGVALQEK